MKLIYKKSLVLCFFLYSIINYSQNLVVNPSFETVNIGALQCSWYLTNSQFTAAIPNWDYPTLGSTDLYHMSLSTSCFSHPLSTNASAVGQQLPRTGNAMSNIITFGNGGCIPYREYLQGELSAPLNIGVTYNIKIYVSLADYSNKGTNNIGIKFNTTRQSQNNMCVWQTTPDVNYTGAPITDKTGWTELSYQYTPTIANILYFSIGNFITDTLTNTTTTPTGSQSTIRYFIDDISIEPASNQCNLTVDAGNTQTIDCNSTQANLNGSATNGTAPYVYSWSPSTGLNNPNIPNPIATPSTTTTYTLTVTDANLCSNSNTVTVNVNSITPLPTTNNTTQSFCTLNNPTLNNIQIVGSNIQWYSSSSSTTTLSINSILQNTTYYATQTINGCEGPRLPITIILNTPINPTFTQVNPICEGSTLTALPLTSINSITGTWSPALNNNLTTTYTFTPDTGQCANTAQMTIVVNQKITPTFPNIGLVCYGQVAPLLPTQSIENILGTWSPSIISNTTSGTYLFTPNVGECSLSSSINISVTNDFDFSFDEFCSDGHFIISGIPANNTFDVNNSTFNWYNNSIVIGHNQNLDVTQYITSNTISLPVTFQLTVSDSNGCPKNKLITISDIYCDIPKGISPNNDTKNDFFDLSLLKVKHLSIYNRYGIKVYDKENYINEWVGETNDGKQLPDGVYYYVITPNSDKETITGWIYINREIK